MKLSIKENSKNYVCTVVEIKNLFPIEGADKIQRTTIYGNNVVVSKNVKIGDKMLYFVSGTKLNEDFCRYNNLLTDAEQNKDKVKGYISHKQFRVKAIKLKGIISDGILLPLSSLSLWLLPDERYNELKVGDEFTDINNVSLCEKYFVPVRNSNPGGKAPNKVGSRVQDVLIQGQFHFHTDTTHFVKSQHLFNQDSEIIITRKIHGSSLILSNVLVKKNLSIKEKILNFLGATIPKEEYGYVWSSGKPKSKLPKGVESSTNKWETPNQSFYNTDIWVRAYIELRHKLEKGISIYAEIVGKGIQGDLFTYNQDYGIYVYRITSTNIDGQVYEFSWEQIKDYCNKYDINYVQEYFVGKVRELTNDNLLEYLQDKYLNKSYPDCKIDEGICIRLRENNEIFKLKSPNFIKMESDNQENDVQEFES